MERFRQELQKNPASRAFLDLAAELAAAGRHEEVVAVCQAGLVHNPHEPRGYLLLGRSLQALGRVSDAQAALVRAVKLDPSEAQSLRLLGEILLSRGERTRAREMFAHALRRSPGDLALRDLFERSGTPVPAQELRPAPAPVWTVRPDATMELTDIEEAEPSVVPPREDQATYVRPLPEALRVALAAELELAAARVASSRADSRSALPVPPRAPAPRPPGSPASVVIDDSIPGTLGGRGESTDEISARDLIPVEVDPGRPSTASIADSISGLTRRRRGARIATIAVLLVSTLAGGAATVALYWLPARRAAAARRALDEAGSAMARADAAGYETARRVLARAMRQNRESREVRSRLALVTAMRLMETGAGTVAGASRVLRSAPASSETDAAGVALSLVGGDLRAAERRLGAALTRPRERKGADAVLAYLGATIALRSGRADAVDRLEACARRFPRFLPPQLALAATEILAGDAAAAHARSEVARQLAPASARPALLSVAAQAETLEPGAVLVIADGLVSRAAALGPCERLLLAAARSHALRRQGKVGEARAALADRPQCPDPLVVGIAARQSFEAGLRGPAMGMIARARGFAPGSRALRLLHARLLLERRQAAEALAMLGEAADDGLDSELLRARAALAAEKAGEARAILEPVVPRAPASSEARLLLLRARVLAGDSSATEEVRIQIEAHPEDPSVGLVAAEAALAARDGPLAARHLAKVLAKAPSAEAHYRMGQAMRLQGRFGDAVASFRSAFEANPDFAEALDAAGNLDLGRGRLEEALASFVHLEGVPGGELRGRLGQAEVLLERGDLAEARSVLDRAGGGHARPGDSPSLRRRAGLLAARLEVRAGNAERALAAIEPLASSGSDAEALALRAEVRRSRGQVDEADDDFAAALAVDAALPEALIGRLEIVLDRGAEALAEELVDRAVRALESRLRPPGVHVRLLCARAHLALAIGDDREANSLLSVATSMAPDHAESWFWLGRSLGTSSERGRAAYSRYLELQPEGPRAAAARRALGPR
ncbi:MAG: tetratricopeptide repeat protein [Deltaproteobacteria bacterium]|nr:tetratricopeptide repeat protein [Deltaproteobacteria bacterium]